MFSLGCGGARAVAWKTVRQLAISAIIHHLSYFVLFNFILI